MQGSHRMVTQSASEKKDFVNAGFAPLLQSVKTRTMAGTELVPAGQNAANGAIASIAGGETGEIANCDKLSAWMRLNCLSVRPSNT